MLPVPEHLRKEYDLPASAKVSRQINRCWVAYNGPHKAQILSTLIALQMDRATPSWGDSKTYNNPGTTHAKLAAMAGVKRSTFSSRMRHLRSLDSDGSDPRRSPVMLRGAKKGKARENYIHVMPVVHSKPGSFMGPNRYTFAIPDGKKPQRMTHIAPGQYVPPDPDELMAIAGVGEFFKPEARQKDPCRGKRNDIYTVPLDKEGRTFPGANGSKAVPMWFLDVNSPLSWTARLVLVGYCLKGLLDPENKGLLKDFSQGRTAKMLGLSRFQVYKANRELNKFQIIRTFSKKVCNGPNGAMRQTPQSILYLPIRQFTEDESAEVLKQYRARMAAARCNAWGVPDEERLTKLLQALITEWQGKEHSISAFWNELRRQANQRGMNKQLLNTALPYFLHNPP